MQTTRGTLLGGRLQYSQPRDGYRTGIEPVLLAASIPAQAGDVVIEAGTGAGAGLMCLAARVADLVGVGVEIDSAMADLARANVEANGYGRLTILTGDVTAIDLPRATHVLANPPWHDPQSTASPNERRRLAKQESAGVEAWVTALARNLADGGSLTMIVPPGLATRAGQACAAAGLGGGIRLSLLPKAGRPPKLVLLRCWSGTETAARTAELILHHEDGAFTAGVEAVLRQGAALGLD